MIQVMSSVTFVMFMGIEKIWIEWQMKIVFSCSKMMYIVVAKLLEQSLTLHIGGQLAEIKLILCFVCVQELT